jgi:soluble lytic murein transglycosylase-like protein/uncharacterized membrane protein YqjE
VPGKGPFLVRKDGPQAGVPYELREPITRIGRAADNDIVLTGADATVVSAHHAEVCRGDGGWLLRDLGSTNGTYVNGERGEQAALTPGAIVQLGPGGPELEFSTEERAAPQPGLSETVVVPAAAAGPGIEVELGPEQDRMLRQAVARARQARGAGLLNQTSAIMREVLATAVHRSGLRLKRIIAVLAVLLVVVSAVGFWKIESLRRDKASIDVRIGELERELGAAGETPAQTDRLIAELDRYQDQARALEKNVLYRWSGSGPQDFLASEIRTLMAEFGAEVYSVPPEFLDAVKKDLERYQGPWRPGMARALGEARPQMERIRRTLLANHLPQDFAYMVLVESSIDPEQTSQAGGAGLWQFTPATARALGLRVTAQVDDRLEPQKSTAAACKYIRNLILDFGSGSSVMLALAAYNLGPTRVKQAIRRVTDPIKQRDFWYLYRVRALPAETREYVPRVMAAMIIGRHPERYGF